MNRFLFALAVAAGLLTVSPLAEAGALYTYTQANAELGLPDGGDYGTVVVSDNTTDPLLVPAGTVRFDFAINPARVGDLFASFAFNSDLAEAVLSAATYTVPTNWSVAIAPPPNQVDGFGKFTVDIGSSAEADRVASGTVLVSGLAAGNDTIAHFQFLSTGTAGEGNVYFAGHLIPGGGGESGFVGATPGGGGGKIPEPSSVVLLGGCLAGLVGLRLRRRGEA